MKNMTRRELLPLGFGAASVYHPISMMDQLFDSIIESPFISLSNSKEGNPIFNKLPLVDVEETENAYRVEAELPGFDEKEIKVHVEGGKLTIESSRDKKKEETKDEKNDSSYLVKERRQLSFRRSLTLPENADTEAVSAVFKNGVLSLEIKKRAENPRRLIEINAQ